MHLLHASFALRWIAVLMTVFLATSGWADPPPALGFKAPSSQWPCVVGCGSGVSAISVAMQILHYSDFGQLQSQTPQTSLRRLGFDGTM